MRCPGGLLPRCPAPGAALAAGRGRQPAPLHPQAASCASLTRGVAREVAHAALELGVAVGARPVARAGACGCHKTHTAAARRHGRAHKRVEAVAPPTMHAGHAALASHLAGLQPASQPAASPPLTEQLTCELPIDDEIVVGIALLDLRLLAPRVARQRCCGSKGVAGAQRGERGVGRELAAAPERQAGEWAGGERPGQAEAGRARGARVLAQA